MMLLILLAGVFLLPAVQKKSAQKAANWFNENYNQRVAIDRFQFKFPNTVYLEKVLVPDHKGDTLFYIGSLTVGLKGYSNISKSVFLSSAKGKEVAFYLRTHQGDSISNLSQFIENIKSDGPSDPNRSFNLEIDKVALTDSEFHLQNQNFPDRIQFHWKNMSGDLKDFLLAGKDVSADIKNLSFNDGEALVVRNLSSQFLYGPKGLAAADLELFTSRGQLKGEITLITGSPSAYSSYVDSVVMLGFIESATIDAKDVQYFSSAYPEFPTAFLNGKFSGPVNDLKLENFTLETLINTRAKGSLNLKATSSGSDLKLHTDDLSIASSADEIKIILGIFLDTLPEVLDKIGKVAWKGNYHGGIYDFNTKSSLQSAYADLNLNMQVANLRSVDKIEYRGNVEASRINLALLLNNNKDFKDASLNLELNGRGLNPTSMKSSVLGQIGHVYYRDYRYQGMAIDGAIAKGNFIGKFNIKDPNLLLGFNGIASFTADTSVYDFKARVDSSNLFALNLVADSISHYKGSMDIDFLGLDFDRWKGTIILKDSEYRNAQRSHYIQDVVINSSGLDSLKSLSIKSDILEGDLKGYYSLSGLASIFKNTIYKFAKPELHQDSTGSKMNFNYHILLKNSSLLSQVLVPQLVIEPGTEITGRYAWETDRFDLNVHSGGIRYQEQTFEKLDFNLLSSPSLNRLSFNLDRYQSAEDGLIVDSIALGNDFSGDSLYYRLKLILRDSIDSYAAFRGRAAVADTNVFKVNIDSAGFNLGKEQFTIDPTSVIQVDSSGIAIDWLAIEGRELKINAQGYLSKNPNKILRLGIKDFNLDLLNTFWSNEKADLRGTLYGDVVVTQILSRPKFLAELTLDSLHLNQVNLGQMHLFSDYDYEDGKIFLDGSLKLKSLEMLEISGFYDSKENGEMDIDFIFNRFRLAALEPFASPVAENLRGLANGTVRISGPLKKPQIKGELLLPKTALTISFLQTDYNLIGEPKLLLDNSSIRFPNLELRDTKYGTTGFLNGEIRHNSFTDFFLDLEIDARELLVLNTGPDREDAYYGKAYASGSIKVQGPPSRVKVKAVVESERKTNFNIPIGGATEVKQSGFVTFVAAKDLSKQLSIYQTNFDLDDGVSLDFDINVKPNAQVSIILNESTGNKLDASGDGLIKMKLEPNKDLELYGTYTVQEGIYRFNLDGLFAKNFNVEEGGTVVWNGDPYSARLDLTAVYSTKANTGVLTGETNGAATQVQVYLFIKGELTNPEINFAIQVPRAASSTQAIIANRLTTDQAINQQVFSLLAFNSFTPPSNFFGGSGTGLNQWDIIAGQAASFLNRFTGDYEVSLSYQPAAQGQDATSTGNSQEELEVGLSKAFFDERLTVNSSVEVPLNENNNSIAGDFELIYKLTKDGQLRAKAFNRSVDNSLNFNIGQQQLYQQGLGLSFKTDFNTYSEIWQQVLQRMDKAKKEETIEVQE